MSQVAFPLTLYIDDACALCHVEMSALAARDAGACLRLVDASADDFEGDAETRAAGLTRGILLRRLHARDAKGRWLVGIPAFAAAYEAAGLRSVARLLSLRALRPALDTGYALVADHRPLLVKLGAPRLLAALLKKGSVPFSPAARK